MCPSNKLLVCDMDGTLLNSQNEISEENIKALQRYVKAGGMFTLATGRMEGALEPFLDRLPINAPAILCNGTVLYDFSKRQTIRSIYLKEGMQSIVRDLMDTFKNIGVLIYTPGEIYCTRQSVETEVCRRNEFSSYTYCCLDDVPEPWYKVLLGDKTECLKEVNGYITEKYLLKEELDIKTVTSSPIYLEIMPEVVSKGNALEELITILDLDRTNVYAVGDNMNDVELIQKAGTGFAVDNALDELKEVADICVGSNDDHAVAQVVKLIEGGICDESKILAKV